MTTKTVVAAFLCVCDETAGISVCEDSHSGYLEAESWQLELPDVGISVNLQYVCVLFE